MNDKNDITFLKFPEVIVVEASAGSGKTYALAKRYLQLLINPNLALDNIPLRSILALTFTNRATLEMKERILELLKKIALDSFSSIEEEKDILDLLGVEKEVAKDKAYRIMEELIKNYDFFQVQTIDSFINALLLGCALNIDRSANFKIRRDYDQYLSYCLDLVIEQATVNKEVFTFLDEFLEHYLFVENRKGWFPKEDILELIRSLFTLSNKYGRLFQTFRGESSDVIKKKRYIYRKIEELSAQFPEDMNANAKKHIYSFLQNSHQTFNIADIPLCLRHPYPSMNKEKATPRQFEKEWRKVYKLLSELIELEAKVSYNPYIKVFSRLLEFFHLVSRKDDVLFLEELNHKVRLLFSNEGLTVSELYYRLATRFRHYLIDEFQDTSTLQWHNLEMMVEEGLSSGGSLFYVGDKKQAIYRFRGGEAELFDKVRDRFRHFNIISTHLTKNWRSQKAIVEFNNKVFSKDNLKKALIASGIAEELDKDEKAISEILDVFKDAVQEYKAENSFGYVYIERIDEKNREERDLIIQPKIIALIKELSKRFQYEDIAILTRDNREVELVTSWCLEAGYPVESDKTLNIIENSLIKEIISFLKFLHSPPDNLSFAAFILGEIFSRVTGIASKDIAEFLFNVHREREKGLDRDISLYRLFRQQFLDVWNQYIDDFFKSVGFISVYELVVSLYRRFKVFEVFGANQAFFMKFLELIKEKEDEYVGLDKFLSYLKNAPAEDLYVNVTHSNSLKILTIHKSKGLEFPVVIIPFLRLDISPETGGKGTNSYVVDEPDRDLRLLRITKNHCAYSSFLKTIYTKSYKKACIDELNNIYVALTRPQFELYAFIPQRSGSAKNKACFLIPENIKEWGEQKTYPRKKRDTQPLIEISSSIYKDWIESLKDEFGDPEMIKNRERVIEGNIMHTILSQIGNCLNQDLDHLLQHAFAYTQARYPFLKDFSSYRRKIKTLVNNESLKDIFYVSKGEVFCEKEVANCFGDLKRIDRLIVREKEVLIIDYKSSQESISEHKEQVREYLEILKDIYPGCKVKGFLVYLDEIVKEEIGA